MAKEARLTDGRSLTLRCGITLALGLPFVVALFVVTELWLRMTTNLPFASRSQCFTQNSRESPAFKPGCQETLRTPQGPISFRTNEDGFRDRPRSFFSKGAVALLGDSYVEGFWLEEEQGLARSLERKLSLGYPLLNLGIRGTGPSQEAIRYYRAAASYPVKGVIWFLNASDPIDETYFLARNPQFRLNGGNWSELHPIWEPTPAYWWWTKLSLFFHDRIYFFVYVAERWIKLDWQSHLVRNAQWSESLHCRSLVELAAVLRKRKIPLLFVATSHGLKQGRRPYLGVPVDEANFESLLACARSTNAQIVDVRSEVETKAAWYWENDWHFNAAGVDHLTDLLAPRIQSAWPGGIK